LVLKKYSKIDILKINELFGWCQAAGVRHQETGKCYYDISLIINILECGI